MLLGLEQTRTVPSDGYRKWAVIACHAMPNMNDRA